MVTNDPKDFKIPTSFTLMGHRYTVEMCDRLYEDEASYGIFDDDLKKILLQPKKTVKRLDSGVDIINNTNFEITSETVVESYYHEVVHAIFEAIGEDRLSANERLVNMMGKALLEIYQTSKYEKKEGN